MRLEEGLDNESKKEGLEDLLNRQRKALFSHEKKESLYSPWTRCSQGVSSTIEQRGEGLLSQGKVACLVLAGGVGSRLGQAYPKGMTSVTRVQKKSLYQILCEKTFYAGVKYEKKLHLIFMTSSVTHKETLDFLVDHDFFGLEKEQVHFFTQEDLPLCDEEGNWFLEAPGKIARGPDGNGRALRLFYTSGLWQHLYDQGVRYLQVVPVDNPLADPFDAQLIGLHDLEQSEVSIKAIERVSLEEKIGVLVSSHGSLRIVEYTELSETLHKDPHFSLGHTGLYCFSFDFIASLVRQEKVLPWHIAWKKGKKWPSCEEKRVAKFECFLFDVLSYAQKCSVLLCPRLNCFSPLKNAVGENSIGVVTKDLMEQDRKRYRMLLGEEPSLEPIELSWAFYYMTKKQEAFCKKQEWPRCGYIEFIF